MSIQYIIKLLLHLLFPINKSVIVFKSCPDYSDNCRALSDYLLFHGYGKHYKIYWCVKDAKHYREKYSNENVRFFSSEGIDRILYLPVLVSAKWMFGTHDYAYKDSLAYSGKKYIMLWHGCSYKDKDIIIKSQAPKANFDIALVAGPFFKKTKSYFWNVSEDRLLAKGYPRYDWLKEQTPNALAMYRNCKGSNHKLVIWMPTFRSDKNGVFTDTDNITDFPLIKGIPDWTRLDSMCRKLKVKIAIKIHPKQKDYDIPWTGMTNIVKIDNEEFERFSTTLYSFLAVTDALITDYSSVGVDYMIVNRPIAYTLDDFYLYKEGRGFVVPNVLDYMPGHHLYSITDLFSFINDVVHGVDKFEENRKRLNGILIYKSDCYCREIVEQLGL